MKKNHYKDQKEKAEKMDCHVRSQMQTFQHMINKKLLNVSAQSK